MNYSLSVLFSTIRVSVWCVIVLVALPRKIFRPAPGGFSASRALDGAIRMLAALMLTTWVLVLLGLFDLFSLAASFVGLTFSRTVIAHRVSPVLVVRHAWRRIVIGFLDLLDGAQSVATKLRALPSAGLHWARRRIPRGPELAWLLSYAAVILGAGALRLIDVLLHPSPVASDIYLQRIMGVVAAGARTMPEGDLYGVDLLLGAVDRLVTVDPTMLVHIAPAIASSALVTSSIACLRHWNVSRGPTLVASAMVALVGIASWFPSPEGIDPLGVELAMAAGLPALVFASQAIGNGASGSGVERNWGLSAAASLGLAVFLHPGAGAVVLVAVVFGVIVSWAMSQRDAGISFRTVGWLTVGGVAGFAPLAVVGLARGDVAALFRSILLGVRAGESTPSMASHRSWPVLLLASAALALLLAPDLPGLLRRRPDDDPVATADPYDLCRVAQRLAATTCLTIAAVAVPERFGLSPIFRSSEVIRVLVPVGGLVVAFVLDELWRALTSMRQRSTGGTLPRWAEFGTSAVAVMALLGSSVPLKVVPPGERLQQDAVALALFEIKTGFPANSWTIVADDVTLQQVIGKGFFLPVGTFAQSYRPDTWRFDPRSPELAVPSRHTFIVLAPPSSTYDPSAPNDPRPVLESWIECYGATHDDLSLFFDEGGVLVWHIDRPPSEDKRVLDEIARTRRTAPQGEPQEPGATRQPGPSRAAFDAVCERSRRVPSAVARPYV